MIDFVWPQARVEIIKNILLPYIAFMIYYMLYLVVLKDLNLKQQTEPAFYEFMTDVFFLADLLFKFVLFLGCFYFAQQDFLQIKSSRSNSISLWAYANVLPLILMIAIMLYDTFIDSESPQVERAFFSLASFFIWIRIVHLMKLFEQSNFLLRLAGSILYNLRYLLVFLGIFILGCGVVFYFLTVEDFNSPFDGIEYIFLLFSGVWSPEDFSNGYLDVLLVVIQFITIFFFWTLLINVAANTVNHDKAIDENLSYQNKCAMVGLYAYLLNVRPFRDQKCKYLAIATVEEKKAKKVNEKKQQAKLLKNFEKKLRALDSKVEKSFKDIMDRLDVIAEAKQPRSASKN